MTTSHNPDSRTVIDNLFGFAVIRARYHFHFDAIRKDFAAHFRAVVKVRGLTEAELATRLGWDPVPEGGNAIMRGEAAASEVDVMRLVDVWEQERGQT